MNRINSNTESHINTLSRIVIIQLWSSYWKHRDSLIFSLCFPVHAAVSLCWVLAAAYWVLLLLVTVTSIVEFLIWLWFPHTTPPPKKKEKKKVRKTFHISAVLSISSLGLSAFWMFHLQKATWTQPCDCQFNHRPLPGIYNKEKEKELSFTSSFLLRGKIYYCI